MSTNPYASPVESSEAATRAHRAEREIHSVVRAFRILAIFSIISALVVCFTLARPLATLGTDLIANLIFFALHIAMLAFSAFYLRIAGKMARGDMGSAKWARRLSLLMVFGFPLFPIGLFCIPVFAIAGLLCYRKVTRYYSGYCEASVR